MMQKDRDTVSGATPELRKLDVLIGRWGTTGRVVTAGEDADILGTDSYEWFPGGFFLLHRVDVSIGGQPVQTLEVIGYDPSTQRYPTRYFDHAGNSGTYIATVSEDVWAFSTEGARASLRISPSGGRMQATWEKLTENGWERWMELEFTKSK